MLCSSSSSSLSSEDGPELNSDKGSEILGDSGASFVPNDEHFRTPCDSRRSCRLRGKHGS